MFIRVSSSFTFYGAIMTYFKVWKIWAASNQNNIVYKLAVFLGLIKSPTFDIFKNVYNVR